MAKQKMMEQDGTGEVHDVLKGKFTVRLRSGKTLDEFCARNFDNYNPDQYEAVAIRLLYGDEIDVTLYALDRVRQEGTNYNVNRIPVKKFKRGSIGLSELFLFIEDFNFTLTAGNYPLEDMEVINK